MYRIDSNIYHGRTKTYKLSAKSGVRIFLFILLWIPFITTPQALWVFIPLHQIIIAFSILLSFVIYGYKSTSIIRKHVDILAPILFSIFAYLVFWFIASFFTEFPVVTLHVLHSLVVRILYFIVLLSAFFFIFPLDNFWRYFSFYHVVVTFFSILLFILLGIGVNLPFTKFTLEDLTGAGFDSIPRYLNYYIGFVTTIFPFGNTRRLIRIMGYCDEGGTYAVFILPFLVYLESSKNTFRYKIWYINILRIGLLLSFSLGGWLSYILFMIIRIVSEKKKTKNILKMIGVISILVLISISLYIAFPQAKWIIDKYLFERALSSDQGSLNTEHGRIIANKESLRIFSEHPIIGTGPGQIRFEAEVDVSSFISILASNGIVGTLLFLFPWGIIFLLSLKMALRGNKVWFYVYVVHLTSLLHRGSLSGFLDFLIAASVVVAYIGKGQINLQDLSNKIYLRVNT